MLALPFASPAVAEPVPGAAPAARPGDDRLAAYVRARAAAADGAVGVAAAGYARALAADPDPVIAIRAFREGLSAGDMALARRALAVLESADVAPADAALLRYADAVKAGDDLAAIQAVERIGQGPLDFIAPVLTAWTAFSGDGRAAIAHLDASASGVLTRRYAMESRALMLIGGGHVAQGMEALQTLLGEDTPSLDLRLDAAELLAGRGEHRLARALLAGPDPMLAAHAASLGDRAAGRGVRATPALGAARLFARLANDLNREETAPLAILLARSALVLDPGGARAQLVLADALARDGATDRALAVLDGLPAQAAAGGTADSLRVAILSRAGEDARALASAQRLANRTGATAPDAQRLGDLLVGAGRYAEAASAYALAMERGTTGWLIELQRGSALEQAGRWDEAQPFLERAVALAPDQPVALNQLGYARAERGEDIDAAIAMLERAAALRPDDPSITDSLGWAYFRSGAIARALPLLEQAAEDEPGATAINEHLGDAYWQAGRRVEARYAWRAASVYAEGDAIPRLAAKIAAGPRGPDMAR